MFRYNHNHGRKVLCVDDNFHAREILSNTNVNTMTLCIPYTHKECRDLISSEKFTNVFLDYNLDEWIGANNQNPMILGGHEIYNGVELASYLLEVNEDIEIEMYSMNPKNLSAALKSSGIHDKVSIIESAQSRGLLKKVQNNLKELTVGNPQEKKSDNLLKVRIRSFHEIPGDPPKKVAEYFAHKLTSPINSGDNIWKSGKYCWFIDAEQFNAQSQTTDKIADEDIYVININAEEFIVEEISDLRSGRKISAKNIEDLAKYGLETNQNIFLENNLVNEYFIARHVAALYTANKLTVGQTVKVLNSLSAKASFKGLKEIFKKRSLTYKSKKALYEAMAVFLEYGFPQILEVFKCRVDTINEVFGVVKLQGVTSEDEIRIEKFDSKILQNHNLEGDSNFEYTIHIPEIGGTGYIIEQI